ncbi:MAG: hypothetical protein KFW09_04135 [Oscillospiraceae bacterium]|nr:hypothetical protein [Oscillospiraceae bacterium]
MKNSSKNSNISFCGVIVSISVIALFSVGIFPFFDFAIPAFAGILLISVVIEWGYKWSFISYIVVCIVGFFISTSKLSVFFYFIIFGYYPILKSVIEKINIYIIEYIIKFIFFNIILGIIFLLSSLILNVNQILNSFGDYGFSTIFISANIVFYVYDIAISKIVYWYQNYFKSKYLNKII